MNNKIIFIVGPTGVGKTEAGFSLAQKLNSEIVSCDAMQVYKEIHIASDKPSLEMQKAVAHHCLDVVSVTEDFNVAQYRQMAVAAIEDIIARGKIPIIVGGSGMYMTVLLDGIGEVSSTNKVLRQELEEKSKDPQKLSEMNTQLRQMDPQAARKIHPHDAKRIIRALEVALIKGEPISVLQKKREGLWDKNKQEYDIEIIALNRERWQLYRRVETRIDQMIEQGLVEEIRGIIQLPVSRTAATLIGIPEVSGYLKGEYDLERVKYLMKLNTRHFVKRQLTWFRRDQRLRWINVNTEKIFLPLDGGG